MLCLRRSFSRVLWAVWGGASWDGAPVLDHQQLPQGKRGARAVQQHPQWLVDPQQQMASLQ